MGKTEKVYYRPARTAVTVSGTLTMHTRLDGVVVPVRVCDVAVATEADPRHAPLSVDLGEDLLHDREFELKLAADERLAGAGYSTAGVGAQILEAGLRAGAFAAKVAVPAVFGFAEEAPPPAAKALDDVFAVEQPRLAERRAALKQAVAELQAAAAREGAAAADAGADKLTRERVKTVQAALDLTHAEAARLETQFESWRAERFPDWIRKLSYTVGVDELPRADVVVNRGFTLDRAACSGDVDRLVRAFHTIAVRIEPQSGMKTVPTEPGSLWYRRPRRLQLAVYELETEEPGVDAEQCPTGPFRLRHLVPAWVVDSYSEWARIPIRSDVFGKDGATAEFGDSGTLTHLTNKQVSAVGGIATALGGAGAAVEASLDQAAKISAALTPTNPALAQLQDDVMWRELQARLVKAQQTIAGGVDSI